MRLWTCLFVGEIRVEVDGLEMIFTVRKLTRKQVSFESIVECNQRLWCSDWQWWPTVLSERSSYSKRPAAAGAMVGRRLKEATCVSWVVCYIWHTTVNRSAERAERRDRLEKRWFELNQNATVQAKAWRHNGPYTVDSDSHRPTVAPCLVQRRF